MGALNDRYQNAAIELGIDLFGYSACACMFALMGAKQPAGPVSSTFITPIPQG